MYLLRRVGQPFAFLCWIIPAADLAGTSSNSLELGVRYGCGSTRVCDLQEDGRRRQC